MGSLPAFNSGFEADEFDDYASDGFDELLLNPAISTKIIIYNDTVFRDGFETNAIIQNVTTDNINNDDIRQILCKIGTLKAGQFIKYKGRNWLISTLPDDNKIYEKAIMEYCNHYLQWIKPDGTIVGRYCIVGDGTKYSTGETESGQMLILGDTRINVRIPRDDESLNLGKSQRFLISNNKKKPTAYKVTKYDDVTDYFVTSGIINLICTEDLFSPERDNQELMIADYYATTTQYTLEILNLPSPFIIKDGEDFSLRINATKDNEAVVVSEIAFSSDNITVATISKQGLVHGVGIGKSTITASFGDKTVNFEAEVQTLPVEKKYSMSLIDTELDNEIIFGDEKQINVKLFEDDIEQNDFTFKCELLDAGGVAEIQSVFSEVGNHAIIVSAIDNTANLNKVFSVRAWNEELSVEARLSIKVVGYF